MLESVRDVELRFHGAFELFEAASVAVFSLELIARVWVCVESPRYASERGRLRYLGSPMALVDLAAIAPFYFPWAGLDLRVMRILRLFRLMRSLKLLRYSEALQTIGAVVRNKREELTVTGFMGLTLLLFASAAMYFVESESQPGVFSSIPASMWWGVVTLTTVGYGDIYPITPVGKFLGAIIQILGVGLFALPAGILAGGFSEQLQRRRRSTTACPTCGREPESARQPSAPG